MRDINRGQAAIMEKVEHLKSTSLPFMIEMSTNHIQEALGTMVSYTFLCCFLILHSLHCCPLLLFTCKASILFLTISDF